MSTEDELEKIARRAVARGYWDERAALEAVAMAKLHLEGPRAFLRKLLERKCGLTYDEVSNLEREALAPPPAQTPSRPLPRLGAARPPSEAASPALGAPQEIVTSSKPIPKLDEKKPAAPAQPSAPSAPMTAGGEILTPKKPLPRLNAPRKRPDEPPPG